MSVFYVPSRGPDDWRRLLADPDTQWRPRFSAFEFATHWEAARGFPEAVRAALRTSPALADLELLLAIPEHKVPLPGGAAASQNDLFVLGRTPSALATIATEGKVDESFGKLVSEWLRDASDGKRERLAFVLDLLRIEESVALGLRYQLLHRAASAILLARQFHARDALMLVHSFSPTRMWFEDYEAFARALGVRAAPNSIVEVGDRGGVRLHIGWVSDRI